MKERLLSFVQINGRHLVSLVLFFLVSAVLMKKSYEGYSVRQGDITNYIGMSQEIRDHRILWDETPGWTGAMFSGMPTVQISPETSSLNIGRQIRFRLSQLFQSSAVSLFFISMIMAYLLALAAGASPWVALLCGLGFGLSSLQLLYYSAGHNSKVFAIAWMPGVVAGVIWAYRRNLAIGAGIAAITAAAHVSAGHPQMTYYLLYLLAAIGITEFFSLWLRSKDLKILLTKTAVIIAAGLIGVAPQIFHLKSTAEYAEYTTRGAKILQETDAVGGEKGLEKDYILEYSMADGEWWSMMCPDIKGGASPLYWGEQSFSGGAFYFGVVVCALFFMFLIAGRDRLKWPLLAVSILAILLSRRDAGVLTDFFLDYVPMFNQFRDTKMMLVIVQLACIMGAALGLKEFLAASSEKTEAKKVQFKWWFGAWGGLFGLFVCFYLMPEVFFDFQSHIRLDRAVEQLGYNEALGRRLEIFRSDVLRTLGLLLLTGTALAAIWRNRWKSEWIILSLALISFLDLWNVGQRYFNDEKVNGVYRNWVKSFDAAFPFDPSPQMMKLLAADFEQTPENLQNSEALFEGYMMALDQQRLTRAQQEKLRLISQFGANRIANPYRILKWDNSFNDSQASYFFQSIGGYHGAKLRRYQDFIDRVLIPQRSKFLDAVQSGRSQEGLNQLVGLQMLNTRYILLDQSPDPILIPNAAGYAWLASDWKWAADDQAEMQETAELNDPQSAVIHESFTSSLKDVIPGGEGRVELASYKANELSYAADLDSRSLVVFSEIWYPAGWKAYIDGEEVETIRVNYVLRALVVPAGQHEILWLFEKDASSGAEATMNILLLLFVFGSFWWGWKMEKKESIEHRKL